MRVMSGVDPASCRAELDDRTSAAPERHLSCERRERAARGEYRGVAQFQSQRFPHRQRGRERRQGEGSRDIERRRDRHALRLGYLHDRALFRVDSRQHESRWSANARRRRAVRRPRPS